MKNYRLLIYLFFSFVCHSQNMTKVQDSLKKYSYADFENKLTGDTRDFDKSYIYAKAYLLKAKKEDNVKKIIDGYYYLGKTANNIQYNIKCSDSAITLAENRRPQDLSLLYRLRGDIFYDVRRLKEALNCYLTANNYPNSSLDFVDRVKFKIGSIKNTQGKYEEAINIYKQCEKNARIFKYKNYLQYVLGLSEVYNRINKIDLSKEYIAKGISVSKDYVNGDYYLPYFIANRGKNNYKEKKYQEAIIDLKASLKSIQNNDDFSNYAENCFYIGKCYNSLNQEENAVKYYKKIDSIFTTRKDIYLLTIEAYNHLINYYKKQKKYDTVIYFSDQFIKADKLLDDNYKYITDKTAKSYDIQNIIASKEQMMENLKTDNTHFIYLISLLLLGVIILIYILYRNNKKKLQELQKQKELFIAYKIERENKLLSNTTVIDNKSLTKKTSIINIDENVINQILECLNKFESEMNYLHKEYTVETLANEFKTNSSYLSKVINEIKEISFTQYINSLRINYIIEILESDKKYLNYTIQALSEFCGYNSVQTFTRAFTTHTKMKPSYFLKTLRDSNLNN